ncbi:heat shock protein transcriptional repressor HspR [Brevibacterium samyangense]|uniref:Helix-turn-helix transcriptional regulator n=1 Tax=Brevibacterium samyangense TaxID=366888 RepID=A0ABP5EMX3_9MICO
MDIGPNAAVYVISVAAELAGMHPQTLRQYDRMGLVSPRRTSGRGRRYSADDIAKLRLIQQLSQEDGINLTGIKQILELREQVEGLRERAEHLSQQLDQVRSRLQAVGNGRVFAAGTSGDVVSILHGQRPESTPVRSRAGELPARARKGELVVYRGFGPR